MAFPDIVNLPLATALLLAFLPLFFTIRSIYRQRNHRPGHQSRKQETEKPNDLQATGESDTKKDEIDVIIVGAGVAGAALAHTLGKVCPYHVCSYNSHIPS